MPAVPMKIPEVPEDLATLRKILNSLPEQRRDTALDELLDTPLNQLAPRLYETIRDALVHTRGDVPAAEWEAQHLPLERLTDRDRWLRAAREGYSDDLVRRGVPCPPDTPETAQIRLARLNLLHQEVIKIKREEHDLAEDLANSGLENIAGQLAAALNISHTTVWRRYKRRSVLRERA